MLQEGHWNTLNWSTILKDFGWSHRQFGLHGAGQRSVLWAIFCFLDRWSHHSSVLLLFICLDTFYYHWSVSMCGGRHCIPLLIIFDMYNSTIHPTFCKLVVKTITNIIDAQLSSLPECYDNYCFMAMQSKFVRSSWIEFFNNLEKHSIWNNV